MKKHKYSNLEILCLGNKTHTGLDAQVLLDGEPVHHKWGIREVRWEIGPEDAQITIQYYRNNKTGERFGNEDGDYKLLEIDYPIKRIRIDYKHLSVESDNTPLHTRFYWDGVELKDNGFVSFYTQIGNAEEIVDYILEGC